MSESIIPIMNVRKAQEIQDWASENCSMFYKAPELFTPQEHKEITESADIWSFGCNLYAAMFNKGPFDYILEHGDSIALAVSNARFTIPNRPTRNEKLVNLVKNTVIVNPNERISLNRIRLELIELASSFQASI
jgi:serine/threonine kinase 16